MYNAFSQFRGHRPKSRILLWIVLAIILIRGLLSNVVMFDPQAADGSLGLVICSGHGPMFPAASTMPAANEEMADRASAATPDNARLGQMDGMTMDGGAMSMPTPVSMSMSARAASNVPAVATNAVNHVTSDIHANDVNDDMKNMKDMMRDMNDAPQDSDAICLFSAVFFAAIVTLVVCLLLHVAAVRRTRFRQGRFTFFGNVTRYCLPLTRAPPFAPAH